MTKNKSLNKQMNINVCHIHASSKISALRKKGTREKCDPLTPQWTQGNETRMCVHKRKRNRTQPADYTILNRALCNNWQQINEDEITIEFSGEKKTSKAVDNFHVVCTLKIQRIQTISFVSALPHNNNKNNLLILNFLFLIFFCPTTRRFRI